MAKQTASVYETVMSRKSVREFKDVPVEEEKLERCLESARWAPSYRNQQCWHFVVVTGKDRIEELGLRPTLFKNVHALVVACGDPAKSGNVDGKPYYLVDVAIAAEHMLLTAYEQGLGSCWVAGFKEGEVRGALGIPEKIKVVALFPIGYPAMKESIKVKALKKMVGSDKRRELKDIVHIRKW